jgi:hypothetical protein
MHWQGAGAAYEGSYTVDGNNVVTLHYMKQEYNSQGEKSGSPHQASLSMSVIKDDWDKAEKYAKDCLKSVENVSTTSALPPEVQKTYKEKLKAKLIAALPNTKAPNSAGIVDTAVTAAGLDKGVFSQDFLQNIIRHPNGLGAIAYAQENGLVVADPYANIDAQNGNIVYTKRLSDNSVWESLITVIQDENNQKHIYIFTDAGQTLLAERIYDPEYQIYVIDTAKGMTQ